jgi:hypothetical protein
MREVKEMIAHKIPRTRGSLDRKDRPQRSPGADFMVRITHQGRPVLAAAIVVALLVAFGVGPAGADSVGRTEGDANAAFNAEPGGGFTIFYMENPHATPDGAPAGGITTGSQEDVRIYPNAKGSYCASGWHVIFLSVWGRQLDNFNYNDLFGYLSAVDIQFAWDGVPLVEEQTAIKRWVNSPNPDFQDAFFFNTGTFMPPGTLSVGRHRLTTTAVDPLYGNRTWSVNVTILPC